jgi:hypothetical protein
MWRNPTSFAECETALDTGKLYAAAGSNRYWLARRNGATKRWKRDATRFRIPIKYGFRGTGRIEHITDWQYLRIADSREEAEDSASVATGIGIGKSTVIYSERTENDITAYIEK